MGQYHSVYNLDKKERFQLTGAKLWEQAHAPLHAMGLNVLLSNSNGRGGGDLCNPIHQDWKNKKKFTRWSNSGQGEVRHTREEYQAIENALRAVSGRWAGDRIVIQGDYATAKDPAFQTEESLSEFTNITYLVAEAFEAVIALEDDDESKKLLAVLEQEGRFLGFAKPAMAKTKRKKSKGKKK